MKDALASTLIVLLFASLVAMMGGALGFLISNLIVYGGFL